ncbi:LysR family transcriptional regulator [Oceanospirillum sediminis]|uniref:LysR family transcriptional regulator n=1 Tax=Oceanospirillum sediminis TaxID=2760088 RepID=A0A839IR53_9GAMM|nr:LysR family transcriptional regulator [Oceanospirillum sediminis]MBB1487765.1 LysR family transcriptional regulator [Oceanospirillum sediminis]
MTFEQLRAFAAVVQCGTFRAAAEHIHKTQSTVSAAIQSLEREFDIQLLDRSQYRPVLTSEGKAFYKQARQLLVSSSDLEQLGHQLTAGTPQQLNIALSAMGTVPAELKAIKEFAEQTPDVSLNITTQHLSGLPEQLDTDKADLAIGPYTGLTQDYEFKELFSVRLICVAAPGYIREQTPDGVLTHKVMRQYPHILIADSGTRRAYDHVNVIPGGLRWYADDYLVKKALLLSRSGWARIPLHMVNHELKQGDLVPLQVENFANQSDVPMCLIRKRDKAHSQLAIDLWERFIALRV